MNEKIEIGYKTFTQDGGEEFGAAREVSPELVIYIENSGEFVVAPACIESVHAQRVIVSFDRLESRCSRPSGTLTMRKNRDSDAAQPMRMNLTSG